MARIPKSLVPAASWLRVMMTVVFWGAVSISAASAQHVVPKSGGQVSAFRILHVASYHLSWPWNVDQLNGFKAGMGDLPAEFRLFEMDTKRRNSEDWRRRVGAEARRLVEEWKPDLLYTNDDYAQDHVAKHYVNTDLPIVFSAVNAAPEKYGFAGSRNVTGVLEQEHALQTLVLLRKMLPGARRIAVIVDDDPTWPGLMARMTEDLKGMPDVEVVAWDTIGTFDEYKLKIRTYENRVDAIGLLGVFGFKDSAGNNVPYEDVLRWTAENSRLPDFSFWADRPELGTLCAVTVSGFEQGRLAGQMARSILTGEKAPAGIAMGRTARGVPVVSLARAKRLGIDIPAAVLLSSKVVTDFAWER